jgi:amino acid transporter
MFFDDLPPVPEIGGIALIFSSWSLVPVVCAWWFATRFNVHPRDYRGGPHRVSALQFAPAAHLLSGFAFVLGLVCTLVNVYGGSSSLNSVDLGFGSLTVCGLIAIVVSVILWTYIPDPYEDLSAGGTSSLPPQS